MYQQIAFALRTPLPLSPPCEAHILQPGVEAVQQRNDHAPIEEAEDEDPDDANVSDDESLDQLEPANASNDEAEHRKREYKIIIMLVRMLVRVIKLKVLDTKQPITLLTTISI
jgi:hypothetical protein